MTTETTEEENKRRTGRPTFAELDARDAVLRDREEALSKAEAKLNAARSGAVRSSVSAEVRSEPVAGVVRERKRKGGQIFDQFEVDMKRIPRGWTYEWKRYQVYGQENIQYDVFMREQGWTAVPPERHPELIGENHKGPIVRDGLMLMERPEELTREAQAEDRRNARSAVVDREAQIRGAPDGQLPRHREDGSSTVSINKSIEAGYPAGMPVE